MTLDYDAILGPELHYPGAAKPTREPIEGAYVRLEPIDPEKHSADLFALSHRGAEDAPLWNYLGYGPFADAGDLKSWTTNWAASSDPLHFAVIDKATGRASGMVSFMRFDPTGGAIEIGHIWFVPDLQKTRQATETIFLMMAQVFERWGYRRLEWKCNSRNLPSRQAALRFGFTYEGLFRQHLLVRGRNRDTTWFAMLDGEWPDVKTAFQHWLEPSNFDAAGKQRSALAAKRG